MEEISLDRNRDDHHEDGEVGRRVAAAAYDAESSACHLPIALLKIIYGCYLSFGFPFSETR